MTRIHIAIPTCHIDLWSFHIEPEPVRSFAYNLRALEKMHGVLLLRLLFGNSADVVLCKLAGWP